MIDVLIKNGVVIDGEGGASFKADVAVKDGLISTVGRIEGDRAALIIDARGQMVCPGFIDLHTHSDFTFLVDGRAQSSLHQGVTTEVVGQCGYSCAPCTNASDLKGLLGYQPGVAVDWRSAGEYLDRLKRGGVGVNVAALVGHGSLRRCVIPEGRGQATDEQLQAMCALLDDSMAQGFHGLSLGLEYEPGIHADTRELVALARVVADRGGILSAHVRNRDVHYDMAFSEVLSVARITGVRLQISHISPKFGAPDDAVANSLAMIDRLNATGGDVAFDLIPDNWGPTLMASVLPSWAHVGGIEATLGYLSDPEARAKMKVSPNPIWQLVLQKRWDLITLFFSPTHPELVGKTMAEIGTILGCDPHDAAFDLLRASGQEMAQVIWAGWNFDESMQRELLAHRLCGVISDAQTVAPDGPLSGNTGAPTVYGWVGQFFQRYVKQAGLLSWEEAVRRITSLPADRMRMTDRGRIHPGLKADITVMSPETIACRATLHEPNRYPDGISHVLVNGEVVIEGGKRVTGNHGRVIRHRES
ncbi:N-acyl-D-amino-acid deacylase family protein [Desulfoluna butyratoxydans]|uniref:Metal-dependent hydrolase n=1 Tax=Desulfoluna butyratoxydans TaxID=231438 RepID=A0A4U8YMI0_9BACT|nr:amidohydrolase family protein [Desulfoluna butyratoxydans]VFQ44734.1 metal-dependent hydrolase [Desulfoluna butyratoxydans]